MKNKKVIIILIAVILVIIGVACFAAFRKKTYTQTFKNFTFEIPNDVEFKTIDDYEFSLIAKNWQAEVDPMYDEYDRILSYPVCTMKIFEDLGIKTDK